MQHRRTLTRAFHDVDACTVRAFPPEARACRPRGRPARRARLRRRRRWRQHPAAARRRPAGQRAGLVGLRPRRAAHRRLGHRNAKPRPDLLERAARPGADAQPRRVAHHALRVPADHLAQHRAHAGEDGQRRRVPRRGAQRPHRRAALVADERLHDAGAQLVPQLQPRARERPPRDADGRRPADAARRS